MTTLNIEQKEEALKLADYLNSRYPHIDSLTIRRYEGRPVLEIRSDWKHKGVELHNAPHLLHLIHRADVLIDRAALQRVEAYKKFILRMTVDRHMIAERRRLADIRRRRARAERMGR